MASALMATATCMWPLKSWAATEVFEKGNALYRPNEDFGFRKYGHAGIYLNSFSNYPAQKSDFVSGKLPNIMNSNGAHSTIEAPGSGSVVKISAFSTFLDNNQFWGSYDAPGGVTAIQRQEIILAAGALLGSPYTLRGQWNGGDAQGDVRCDGVVAIAYAAAGLPIPVEANGAWNKNSPGIQRKKLALMSSASAPTCGSATANSISGGFKLSVQANGGC